MGNICRSPSAEGVVRALLKQRAPQLSVHLDSAGTHDYHVGEPPDRRTIAAARRREIDLSGLRARMVTASDFTDFDLILAMDESNARELRARAATIPRAGSKIRLMMDFVPDSPQREVPDPYYGGPEGFEEVLDLLEAAAAGLLKELQQASI
jgi:protein-tyrosine phosphatase